MPSKTRWVPDQPKPHSEWDPVVKKRINLTWEQKIAEHIWSTRWSLQSFAPWAFLVLYPLLTMLNLFLSFHCFTSLSIFAYLGALDFCCYEEVKWVSFWHFDTFYLVNIWPLLPSHPFSVPRGGFLLLHTQFLLSWHIYSLRSLLYLPPNSLKTYSSPIHAAISTFV